jgi:ribosomal protein S18 acetylase RimI-like enzyme
MSTEVGESVLIRAATEDDIPFMLENFRKAFRLEAPSESELRTNFGQCPEGFIVLQVGEEFAGCSAVFMIDGRPHLHSTAVVPEFRSRRGLGTKLVAHQVSTFRRLGYSEIDTWVGCSNIFSIRMCEKVGFKHVRTTRNFFSFPKGSARLMLAYLASDGTPSMSPNLRDKVKDIWGRVVEPRLKLNRGLQVAWFDRWYPVLDNALHELPEMPNCPHELFRTVMQNPGPTRKRIALVTEGPDPLAVVGLRQKGKYWLPVMQEIIPECIAPARDGFLFPALRALGVEVRIADWPIPPPRSARASSVMAVPVFSIHCQSDYEGYWRKSHYMETIRKARKRTEAFTFEVDRPGSAALIIAKWAEKWRDHPDQQTIIASDLVVAADYCQQRNRWHSFLLLDGDVAAAGATFPVHGNDLLGAVIFRDKRYNWQSAGNRLMDLITQWAAEHGFAKYELGGWYDYKAKCGPQDGEHWDFRICPLRQHLRDQITWKAKAVPGKLKALFARLPLLSGAHDKGSDQDAGAETLEEAPEVEPGNTGAVRPPAANAHGVDD